MLFWKGYDMKYANQSFDEERALYGVSGAQITDCIFDGPADGESALKETSNITVERCYFNLRYPFWHTNNAVILECTRNGVGSYCLW